MKISVNTVRSILDTVYGKYSLETDYCNNVGLSKRAPANSRVAYRFTVDGHTSDWMLASYLVELLGPIAARRNSHKHG
jgi:hypothetical protein